MVKHISIGILCSLLVFGACKQASSSEEKTTQNVNNAFAKQIKVQANAMAQLLLKKDYKSFSKFTFPKIKEMMGGEEGMVKMLEQYIGGMEANGYSFVSLTIDEPSDIVKSGNELQCVVPEKIEMKVPGGKAVSNAYLIAISEDNGNSWYFIDTSSMDIAKMKEVLPNLSAQLVIPEKEKPTFIKD